MGALGRGIPLVGRGGRRCRRRHRSRRREPAPTPARPGAPPGRGPRGRARRAGDRRRADPRARQRSAGRPVERGAQPLGALGRRLRRLGRRRREKVSAVPCADRTRVLCYGSVAGNCWNEIVELRRALQVACEALDPDSVPLPEVVDLYEELIAVENLVAGAKLRLLRKLDEAPMDFGPGVRSKEEEIARRSGSSVGKTRESMKTSKRLAGPGRHRRRPAARGAVRGAGQDGLRWCRRRRRRGAGAAADGEAQAAARPQAQGGGDQGQGRSPTPRPAASAIRRSRFCRTLDRRRGCREPAVRHLPEAIAEIESLLAPFTQAAFDAARQPGEHESHDAYRADGLPGHGPPPSRPGLSSVPKGASRAETKVFVHIDLETLVRGRLAEGAGADLPHRRHRPRRPRPGSAP